MSPALKQYSGNHKGTRIQLRVNLTYTVSKHALRIPVHMEKSDAQHRISCTGIWKFYFTEPNKSEYSVTDLIDEQGEYLAKNFTKLNLSANEILSKEFDGCTFKECNLSESILSYCKFIDCLFIKCNLSVAKIDHCRFTDVTFDECKLTGIDWSSATWASFMLLSPIKFFRCIINDCTFFGLNLQEIVIEACKAHNVDFRGGDFSEANFTYSDFSNSLFNNTNLTRADFTDATNYNIDVYFNKVRKAKFCRSEAVSLLDSLGIELVD